MKCIKAPFLILSFILFLFGFDNTAQSAVVVAPGSIAICQNTSTFFSVVNTQPASSLYTWQDSSATGWVNLVNNTFLVAVNDTLFVNNISYSYNNSKFRCIVDSAGAGLKKDTSGGKIVPNPTDKVAYVNWGLKDGVDTLHLTKIYYNKSSTTGIADMLHAPFSLYPNPSNGVVNIKSNNIAITSIKMFDNQMRLIENVALDNTLAAQIKLNAPPGIYIVQITDSQLLNYWAKLILGG
jgi:hypothetical protein